MDPLIFRSEKKSLSFMKPSLWMFQPAEIAG